MPERLAWYVLCLAAALGMIVLGHTLGKAHEAHEPYADWRKSQTMTPEAQQRLNVGLPFSTDH